MPVKAVIIGVAAAAAVGAVVWQNREQILEIAEQTRDDVREFAGERIAELAELLRRVAEKISPDRQEEIPMRGRALGFSPSPSTGSRRSGSLPRSSPAADPFASPPSGSHRLLTPQRPPLRLTGRDSDFTDGLRFRSTASNVPAPLVVRSYNDHYSQEIPLPPSVASSSIVLPPAVVSPPVKADIIPSSPSAETLIAASQQEALSETISFRSASLRSAISDTISDVPETVVVTPPVNPFENPLENPHPFWSIPEWQENTAEAIDTPSSPSLAGSAADELDNLSEIASDSGSEGSWMEVASVTSDDDMINH